MVNVEILVFGQTPNKSLSGRLGGFVVTALDSGSDLSPVRDIVLCSRARHFTLTALLSTQVYKWVPVNFLLQWTSTHPRESRNTSSHLILQKLG